MRTSGILLPVFSLPSKTGIGCFSKEAYDFIDKLAAAGQRYWQVLPINHAGGWHSPYQPLSCFAIDPIYIDPYILYEEGCVCSGVMTELGLNVKRSDPGRADYETILPLRMQLYRNAFETFKVIDDDESSGFTDFCKDNSYWLDDYAAFVTLSDHYETVNWSLWPDNAKHKDEVFIAEFCGEHSFEVEFYKWLQFKAYVQWQNVRSYAHEKGIDIIGDIPIYVAYESAECWADQHLFKLKKSLKPEAISGCPPDAFSPVGQVWGNPLYKWQAHKADDYTWWIRRLQNTFKLYDVVRLDHFRGFESFFAVPAGDETAENGRWMRGPGIGLFDAIFKAMPGAKFIAEDLGHITPKVNELKKKTGLPGMKVIQFAFDGDENNPYLPKNHEQNCVVYTGTHDNDTTYGWYQSLDEETKRKVTSFIRQQAGGRQSVSQKAPVFGAREAAGSMVQIAMRSKADTCIIPVQDHLLLGSEARINTPGTKGDNWRWRLREELLTDNVLDYILTLTKETGRMV